jgi:hypothetical protein
VRSYAHLAGVRHSLLRRVALIFMTAVVLTALVLALAAYFITKHDQDGRALSDAVRQSRQNLTVADAMLPAQPKPADFEGLMAAFADPTSPERQSRPSWTPRWPRATSAIRP